MFNTVKELTPGISVSLLPSIQNSFNPLSCSSTSGCKAKLFFSNFTQKLVKGKTTSVINPLQL